MKEKIIKTITRNKKTIKLLAIVAFFALATSLPTLSIGFLSDEYEYIEAAHDATSDRKLANIFTAEIGEFWRPTIHASFLSDYLLFDQQPAGYHFTNAMLHTISSILVSIIALQIIKLIAHKKKVQNKYFIPITAGILFAIFPNHHEAVTWLAGRTDLLATTLYLATIACWLSLLLSTDKYKTKILLTTIFTIFALGAKEIAITLPIIITVTSVIAYKKIHKSFIITSIISWLSLAIYLFARKEVLGSISGGYEQQSSIIQNFLTAESILRLLKTPILFFQHFINKPEAAFLFTPRKIQALTIVGIFTALVAITYTIIAIHKKQKTTIIALCAGFFLTYISALPMFDVLKSLNSSLESTRYLYLPSVGIAIAVAAVLHTLPKKIKYTATTLTIFICLTAWTINFSPWQQASNLATSISDNIKNTPISSGSYIAINNIPDNINGAFVFRRGLESMIRIHHGKIANNHIAHGGRGIRGTHFSSCIQNLDNDLLLINIDPATNQTSTQTIPPQTFQNQTSPQSIQDLKNYSSKIDLQNIEEKDNGYVITGKNAYIRFNDLQLDPKQISQIQTNIDITDENQKGLLMHLYWKTKNNPTENEFNRHIIIPSKQSAPFDVCRYPAFFFSDTITSLRINVPFEPGFVIK